MSQDILPIYHGKRFFLGMRDLVVSMYTQRCEWECSFCDIPTRSSDTPIEAEAINNQLDWIIEQYEEQLPRFEQFSIGNEGSILDKTRFPDQSFRYLLECAKRMPNLRVLSLETRPEYITNQRLDDLQGVAPLIDMTVGLETQDDYLRNEILTKRMSRDVFERKVALLGERGMRLTSYVMLKPGPEMTEQEGQDEALRTVDYLNDLSKRTGAPLVIYLNPTYMARKSSLAKRMAATGWQPPTIRSLFSIVLETAQRGILIYTGLWSEGLAFDTHSTAARTDEEKRMRNAIKRFNQRQELNQLLRVA